jgi:hypothetical protein
MIFSPLLRNVHNVLGTTIWPGIWPRLLVQRKIFFCDATILAGKTAKSRFNYAILLRQTGQLAKHAPSPKPGKRLF